jgi:hypothetical protein
LYDLNPASPLAGARHHHGDRPWSQSAAAHRQDADAPDRAAAARLGRKATMRKNLQAVEDAANTLIDALNDGAMRGFLDEAPEEIPYHGHLDHMFRDLARRAEESIVSLSTADGATKPGRNKAMPRRASHPKSYCAALIAEAWAYFHGGDPPPRNRHAAAAADALWRAAGGETKGWGCSQPAAPMGSTCSICAFG